MVVKSGSGLLRISQDKQRLAKVRERNKTLQQAAQAKSAQTLAPASNAPTRDEPVLDAIRRLLSGSG